MKYKKALLFSIIIFSLFSSLFTVNSLGTLDNIEYTFNDNIIFDDTIDSYETSNPGNFDEPYNLRYQSEYTKIYNATYSFTNEIVGTSGNFIDFIDSNISGIDTTLKIISEIDGHSKVLEFNDNDNSALVKGVNNLENIFNGTIEFWIRTIDKTKTFFFDFNDNDVLIFRFQISTNFFKFFNGTAEIIRSVDNSVWFHISISWNSIDNWFLFINDIEFSVSSFNNMINGIDEITMNTASADINSVVYLDGVGFFFGENFDFEQDSIGSEPLYWNVQSFGTGTGTVERFQGSNVFKIFDDSIHEGVDISTDLHQSIDQLIEYDIAINDTSLTQWYNMIFTEGGSGRISLQIDNDDLDYHNGISFLSVKDDFIIVDTWFKITIVLDDSTDTFDIYIDDILEGSNLDYSTSSTISVDGLVFASDGIQVSTTYLDNFNISSTDTKNYYVGQNLFPYIITSNSLMEVDKYEFALNDIHTFNAIGDDDTNGWTDIESPSGDKVNIDEEPDGSYDRLIKIDTNVISDFRGILKGDLGINGDFIGITWGFFATILDGGNTDSFNLQVESSDGTIILNCKVLGNLSVVYGGANPSVFINVFRDIVLGQNNRYDFNFLLNYELDIIFFTYSLNGVIQEIYSQPMANTEKQGLKQVNIGTILNTANTMKCYIDYIGIYNNGKSQVDFGIDFGIALIDINNVWNRENHNLLYFIANGTFHIAGTSLYYFYGRSTPSIKKTTVYHNENYFVNAYSPSTIHLFTGLVVLTVLGINFNFSYLKIDGVLLNENSNSYNLIFEHSGINIQESFFYTDSNNKLQFTHISNDTDTEFIQARFNINDSTSTEASISFRSLINNNAKGFFRINYTSTSDFIPFPVVQSTTSIFLTQGNNIRDFLIIITDLDDDNIIGLTSGFVDNVKIIYLGNVQISVITLSLIGMIVPLIIILTPTVALRDLYGESFVVPIFLLMSLILTIGGIIPIWLFFIIAISSSLFLIKGSMERDD